jgi:hypothetical protein
LEARSNKYTSTTWKIKLIHTNRRMRNILLALGAMREVVFHPTRMPDLGHLLDMLLWVLFEHRLIAVYVSDVSKNMYYISKQIREEIGAL